LRRSQVLASGNKALDRDTDCNAVARFSWTGQKILDTVKEQWLWLDGMKVPVFVQRAIFKL
jgi:hypothetical protein